MGEQRMLAKYLKLMIMFQAAERSPFALPCYSSPIELRSLTEHFPQL